MNDRAIQDESEITALIAGVKQRDDGAVSKLWQLYIRRVAGVARHALGTVQGAVDEEDVAHSALRSFCLRAGRNGFARLNDRRDLWSLLATITFRKALKELARQARQPATWGNLEQVLSQQPAPEFEVDLREQIEHLLKLVDEDARRVAGLLMSGHTNEEVSQRCGFSLAKVERKRRLLRETWRRELDR